MKLFQKTKKLDLRILEKKTHESFQNLQILRVLHSDSTSTSLFESKSINSEKFYVSNIKRFFLKRYDNVVLKYNSNNKEIFDKNFDEKKYKLLSFIRNYRYVKYFESKDSLKNLTGLGAFNLGIKFRLKYYKNFFSGLIKNLYDNDKIDFDYVEAINCNNINDSKINFKNI